MRIAIVTPSVNLRGGTEKCLSWLIEDLSRHANVTVFTGELSDTDVSKCRVVLLPMVRHPRLLRYATFLVANTVALAFHRVFKKHRFDLVIATGGDCIFSDIVYTHFCCAAWLQVLSRGLVELPSRTVRQRLRNLHYRSFLAVAARIEGAIYRSARLKAVLAVSTGTKIELVRHYCVDPARVTVLPNAVDDRVRISRAGRWGYRQAVREQYRIPQTAMLLLFVAAGDWKRKGLLLVIQALASLDDPRVHLLVVGREDVAFYQQEARRAGCAVSVHFAGFTAEIERYYAAADVFVYPSAYESFSLVTLEAAAAGLPLIVTRLNGTEELLREGENGFLVRPEVADIAARLRLLRADSSRLEWMAASARASSQRFTRSAVLTQALGVCTSLMTLEASAA